MNKYLKYAIYAIFAGMLIALIISCKSVKEIPIQYREVIKEKLIPVINPADSANLTALFECDSTNHVILKQLKEAKTAHVESSSNLNNGVFTYKIKTVRDTIYIPSKETTITKEVPVKVEVPVNYVNWWQKILIWIGGVVLVGTIGFIAFKIFRSKIPI